MRINTGQTANIFQTGSINQRMNRNYNMNQLDKGQQAGALMRTDIAAISPQGKASGLLANLMNQKELIQSNKDFLITRALDDESGAGSAALQEQLEEYEKQLDTINEQIAAAMASQAESTGAQGSAGKAPQGETGISDGADSASEEEQIAELTKLSADLEKAQVAEQAHVRREGEKRVCESEIKLGSVAAERKLDKIKEVEKMTGQLEPLWRKRVVN